MVVDASVIVNALGNDGPHGHAAREAIAGVQPIAPDFIDLEVMSAWRRQVIAGELDEHRAAFAVHSLAIFPLARVSTESLIKMIWQLRNNLTTYDASYVALATAFDVPLLTADRRKSNAPNLPCEVRLMIA